MKGITATSEQLYGYTGKILRIDLTNSTTEIIPTSRYVPRYTGGMAVSCRIFWDEVGPDVKAYDPENLLIFMTGAPCGTGMPASNRLSVCSISPNSLPEMFTHSNMGGYFSGMLKFAGYDGIIVVGKAPKHTYVYIEDDKVQFLDADDFIWGEYVHETQEKIFDRHGRDAHSVVIGPAGEHLHRNASVTNGNDSAAAKTGFGAVMGSKNLKAIAVKGTGEVRAFDPVRLLDLRTKVGYPKYDLNPFAHSEWYYDIKISADQNIEFSKVSCGYGCNRNCMMTMMDQNDVLHPGQKTSQVVKCVDGRGYRFNADEPHGVFCNVYSKRQQMPRGEVYDKPALRKDFDQSDPHANVFSGSYQYNQLQVNDTTDPDLPFLMEVMQPGKTDYFRVNFNRGALITQLTNEYGLDKWDFNIWYLTWLGMCSQEGLLDDLDFGMEVDLDNPEFIRKFIDDMVYRRTPLGNIFAEGMARAIRKLGKAKYGNSIYHGRYNTDNTIPYDIPVSLEAGWGHTTHYSGRGFQANYSWLWLTSALNRMAETRDALCNRHTHVDIEDLKQYRDDPYHSPVLARVVRENEEQGVLKDSLVTCEWKSPNPGWPDMEADMYNCVTGLGVTKQDLLDAAHTGWLVYRAIQIRNHGRCRDQEVEEAFPYLTFKDPYGEYATWEDWNDLVDLYYDAEGFDRSTGWPKRSELEAYGLKDIADELEKLGRLGAEDCPADYVRKENPFTVDGHFKPEDYK